jgi:hypothetical protein
MLAVAALNCFYIYSMWYSAVYMWSFFDLVL